MTIINNCRSRYAQTVRLVLVSLAVLSLGFTRAGAQVVFSSGTPSGTLPAGISSVNIGFDLNANAITCRYSTAPNTPYNSMTVEFPMRGATHFTMPVQGLNSGIHHFYACCVDSSWHENLTDYDIAFAIASETPPSISAVSGSVTHKNSVTITGTGFGVKTPAEPILWDDFEAGVSSGYLSAYSNWKPYKLPGPSYSGAQAYSGQLSAYNRGTPTSGFRLTPEDDLAYVVGFISPSHWQIMGSSAILFIGRIDPDKGVVSN